GILCQLAPHVGTGGGARERARQAERALADLGYANVEVHVAGETLGWPEGAPYDAIIVTAGAPRVPHELVEQMRIGGRMAVPVGSRDLQELVQVVRSPEGPVIISLGPCRFVPLVGPGAWSTEPLT